MNRRVKRQGDWTEMPSDAAMKASQTNCCICRVRYGTIVRRDDRFTRAIQAIDHVFPRRFLQARDLYPHAGQNLLSICAVDHGRKLTIETLIFTGDTLGWLTGLNVIGYPLDAVYTAAKFYGFNEVLALLRSIPHFHRFAVAVDMERGDGDGGRRGDCKGERGGKGKRGKL